MFENERTNNEEIIIKYRDITIKLSKYIPWLESKKGSDVMKTYVPEHATASTMRIPTYDSTLINFVKELDKSGFVDRNYRYIYSRYTIRSAADERRMIARAQIKDMDILFGILSRYYLEGRVKASVWKEGVENGIYLECISKIKELIEFWDMPFDKRKN